MLQRVVRDSPVRRYRARHPARLDPINPKKSHGQKSKLEEKGAQGAQQDSPAEKAGETGKESPSEVTPPANPSRPILGGGLNLRAKPFGASLFFAPWRSRTLRPLHLLPRPTDRALRTETQLAQESPRFWQPRGNPGCGTMLMTIVSPGRAVAV
jgi:hypothetical protein